MGVKGILERNEPPLIWLCTRMTMNSLPKHLLLTRLDGVLPRGRPAGGGYSIRSLVQARGLAMGQKLGSYRSE